MKEKEKGTGEGIGHLGLLELELLVALSAILRVLASNQFWNKALNTTKETTGILKIKED